MVTINPFDFFLEPEAETWPFTYDPVLEQELAPFRKTDAGRAAAAPPCWPACRASEQRTVDMLVALNRRMQKQIAYIVRLEPGVWTPEETLAGGKRLLPRFRLAAGAGAAPSRLSPRASSPAT